MNQTTLSSDDAHRSFDAVVVGAGMGGLMAAALLASEGRKVLVLEASSRIGGFQHRFERNGFRIDANFHFLQEAGPGRPVRKLLAAVGIEPQLVALDPLAEFSFPDRVVRMSTNRTQYRDDLIAMFPAQKAGIVALFDSMATLYQRMQEWPAGALRDAAPENLPPELAALAAHANETLDQYLEHFVSSRELKAILGGWATYFGYCGARIAALPVIVLSEAGWDGGNFHPVGGIDTIAQALKARVEAGGGAVKLSTPVRRILVDAGRATGVELESGEVITAAATISNADVFTTYRDLIGADNAPAGVLDGLAGMERFRSPLSVYVGVRADGLGLEKRAAVHVVFPSYDTDGDDLAQDEGQLDRVAVSIGIPTLVTPELAPPGHHLLKIYSFVGASLIERLRHDDTLRQETIRQFIAAAERTLPGLADRVVMTELSTDAYPSFYNAHTQGAIGWAPNMAAMMAAPDQATAIQGFYLVGQWTNTGPAMNNVFRSSHRVAELILRR